ncbi:hypothetical protein FSP39_019781 [Pinctada imbricata]|uniref:Galactose-3-O-sulfotransferase 3 n=1 Tax=Pinctada imbricata TaxID=66713 RepID=A0AA89CC13_PINIB|nr:hypothetical protein FSP39_019781 [Pinctada imbricata]
MGEVLSNLFRLTVGELVGSLLQAYSKPLEELVGSLLQAYSKPLEELVGSLLQAYSKPLEENRRCVFIITIFSLGALYLYNTVQLQRQGVTHIVFIKVHKAASSSIQNIFLRYGYNRNLTFVLGKNSNFYPQVISYSDTVSYQIIEPPPTNRAFDIMCSHVIYNRRAFESIMPRDTMYFGILREPYSQFVSTLHYFRPPYIFDIEDDDPISVYLKDPSKYEIEVKYSSTNNRQAFEFGFPLDIFKTRDMTRVNEYLRKLDSEFKLVLIAEYLPESVILMRRYLNWTTKDVIYILKNAWSQLPETNQAALNIRFHVSNATRTLYKTWATLDYALYDYFVQKLHRQILAEGSDFQSEVSNFRNILGKIEHFCNKVSRPYRFVKLHIDQTRWNGLIVYTTTDCSQLLLPEKDFHDEIRNVQYPNKTLDRPS